MDNKVELDAVHEKIKSFDIELDTFIRAVHEIKEIRRLVGTLPDDLKHNNAEIENQRKDFERLLSSSKDLLSTFEEQAKGIIFDLEEKAATLAVEAKSNVSEITDTAQNSGKQQEIEKRIKKVEEDVFVLTRQQYAIMIMSAVLIASVVGFTYIVFIQ